ARSKQSVGMREHPCDIVPPEPHRKRLSHLAWPVRARLVHRTFRHLPAGIAIGAESCGPVAIALVERHKGWHTSTLHERDQGQTQGPEVVELYELGLFCLEHTSQARANGRPEGLRRIQ